MLNEVVLMGRLTRDPEVKKTQSDVSVCSFSIACERDIVSKQTNERETDYFDVVAWRSTADFIGKYFAKGRMIIVKGRLQKRYYDDKEGNKRNVVEVVADTVYFGESKKSAESSTTTTSESAPKPAAAVPDFDPNDVDDDLPF
ncbi:single-stranded DNA-binding protein [bacterium D16-76]|nr:single-stranded DNA-binding protein [bacterium D16-76]